MIRFILYCGNSSKCAIEPQQGGSLNHQSVGYLAFWRQINYFLQSSEQFLSQLLQSIAGGFAFPLLPCTEEQCNPVSEIIFQWRLKGTFKTVLSYLIVWSLPNSSPLTKATISPSLSPWTSPSDRRIANAGILHNSTHLERTVSAWDGFMRHNSLIVLDLIELDIVSSCFSPVCIKYVHTGNNTDTE